MNATTPTNKRERKGFNMKKLAKLIPIAAIAIIGGVYYSMASPASAVPQLTLAPGAPVAAICHSPAYAEQCSQFLPAQAAAPGNKSFSQNEAILHAKNLGNGDNTTALTKAVPMTYAQFVARSGQGADPLIDANRPVWVVTVHGHATGRARAGSPVPSANVYTVVFDGPSGMVIARGIGADVLK